MDVRWFFESPVVMKEDKFGMLAEPIGQATPMEGVEGMMEDMYADDYYNDYGNYGAEVANYGNPGGNPFGNLIGYPNPAFGGLMGPGYRNKPKINKAKKPA